MSRVPEAAATAVIVKIGTQAKVDLRYSGGTATPFFNYIAKRFIYYL
jgi:hypothetical protein